MKICITEELFFKVDESDSNLLSPQFGRVCSSAHVLTYYTSIFHTSEKVLFLLNLLDSNLFLICYPLFFTVVQGNCHYSIRILIV